MFYYKFVLFYFLKISCLRNLNCALQTCRKWFSEGAVYGCVANWARNCLRGSPKRATDVMDTNGNEGLARDEFKVKDIKCMNLAY